MADGPGTGGQRQRLVTPTEAGRRIAHFPSCLCKNSWSKRKHRLVIFLELNRRWIVVLQDICAPPPQWDYGFAVAQTPVGELGLSPVERGRLTSSNLSSAKEPEPARWLNLVITSGFSPADKDTWRRLLQLNKKMIYPSKLNHRRDICMCMYYE